MEKEEFIKQRCEIDDITEEEFESTYRVIECNCGKPYCKGYRCLDLDDLCIELKKQKEINQKAIEYIKNNLIVSSILDGKKYYSLNDYGFDYRELLEILEDKEV